MKETVLTIIMAMVFVGCGNAPVLEKDTETVNKPSKKTAAEPKASNNVSPQPVEEVAEESVIEEPAAEDNVEKKEKKKVVRAKTRKTPTKKKVAEKEEEPIDNIAVLQEMTKMGYELYSNDCAQCHGENSIDEDLRVRNETLSELVEEFEGGHEGINKTMEELQYLSLAINDAEFKRD